MNYNMDMLKFHGMYVLLFKRNSAYWKIDDSSSCPASLITQGILPFRSLTEFASLTIHAHSQQGYQCVLPKIISVFKCLKSSDNGL